MRDKVEGYNMEKNTTIDIDKFEEVQRWAWKCYSCGEWNEIDDNPDYLNIVDCESCRKRFTINKG